MTAAKRSRSTHSRSSAQESVVSLEQIYTQYLMPMMSEKPHQPQTDLSQPNNLKIVPMRTAYSSAG